MHPYAAACEQEGLAVTCPEQVAPEACVNRPYLPSACPQVALAPAATKPIDGQKTGTSGLRKKTKEFMSPNYLANWVQSLFNALGDEVKGQELALGGDGRYFGKEAAQIIIKLAAGNGFKKVLVGRDAILATPAASAVIRRRKLYGEWLSAAETRLLPVLSSPPLPAPTPAAGRLCREGPGWGRGPRASSSRMAGAQLAAEQTLEKGFYNRCSGVDGYT